MIPKDCKRLIEVDFPIAEVSRHAAREKSIRHGHPSTLHLWWARRPLASSRAVLLGLLWPDPCDPLCPEAFKEKSRELLPRIQGSVGPTNEHLRKALLKFISDFANWDLASNSLYLELSRKLVSAAYGKETPLVVDPFAGGGSIPLEAIRLGCETFGSDLNPIACMILKMMIEDIPREGIQIAEDLRRIGTEIRQRAELELADMYPRDPDGASPVAYLWARTVRCEAPSCGAEVPIFKSPWLAKRASSKAQYFRESATGACVALLIDSAPLGGPIHFRIAHGDGSEEAQPDYVALLGTKAKGNNANVICPCCNTVLPGNKKNPRTRIQLTEQRGGADVAFDGNGHRSGGARLLAVVTLRPGETGKHYRLESDNDYTAVRRAQQRLEEMMADWDQAGREGLCPIPDETLPLMSGTFNVPIYGVNRWGDLFTARQKIALLSVIRGVREGCPADFGALQTAFAMVIGRTADYGSAGVVWSENGEFVAHTFGRQALPMVWDFAETVPWTDSSGNLKGAIDWVARVIEAWPSSSVGNTQCADAAEHPLPDESASIWFTDPPYYFAVPYADLSDFFFVWLKRAFPGHPLLRDPYDPNNPLTHKDRELCEMAHWDADRYSHKDQRFFEDGMRKAFSEGRRELREDGVGCVVFAHKTTEAWEALLSGMIGGGWTLTASWPIATERPGRLRSQNSAALATSVHLICRPRPTDAKVGDWADVLRELPNRVGDWMERLQGEGVRGADLVFACIGPALEVFSRYSRVETAEGRQVELAEYLEKVWEVVGRSALAQVLGTEEAKARNGAAGAVEEDARLTALFLWTLQSTTAETEQVPSSEDEFEEPREDEDDEGSTRVKPKGFTLVFDVVRRFAQPLGIDLPQWEGRVIETKKGVVRLLPIAERAQQLFGEEGAHAVAARLELEATAGTNPLQGMLFPETQDGPRVRGRGKSRGQGSGGDISDDSLKASREATILDRVHAAMLLQGGGRTNALRSLFKAEQERGPDFMRLANALSALYPKGSEEKRLLDAMLLAAPR